MLKRTNLNELDATTVKQMAGGTIQRQMIEICMAFCKDCKRNVTEWGFYTTILEEFIDHRRVEHHTEKAVVRSP